MLAAPIDRESRQLDRIDGGVPRRRPLHRERYGQQHARREAADIQAIIDQEKGGFPLAAWDWDYYSEKVRRARYDFDEAQLKPYFELNRVLHDGVFHAATRLFGITFQERRDFPVYEPTVRVFEVFNADGSTLALFVTDFYARPSKRGGAWASARR